MIDFDEADYKRLREAADQRGMTFESFVAAQAIQSVPVVGHEKPTDDAAESWDDFFGWLDSLKLKPSGWTWNREELYDRKVLR